MYTMAQLDDYPTYSRTDPNFTAVDVIHHGSFKHHILYSLQEENAIKSIETFMRLSDGHVIGFDMEWISKKSQIHTDHTECLGKAIVCTIQFGCQDMSLVFCLYWIYKNDQHSCKIPNPILDLLGEDFVCFGGYNDLRILRECYPSDIFECKMEDPIPILKNLGAYRPNLLLMAKLLLNFDSDKMKPNINWIIPSRKRLISAGEDAILSYQIHKYMESTSNDEISEIMTNHFREEISQTRKKHIQELYNPIINKIWQCLSDDDDGITYDKYSSAMSSFLGTMKLPIMKSMFFECNGQWGCEITVNLDFLTLKSKSVNDQKRKAKNEAVRKILRHPCFRETLVKMLN